MAVCQSGRTNAAVGAEISACLFSCTASRRFLRGTIPGTVHTRGAHRLSDPYRQRSHRLRLANRPCALVGEFEYGIFIFVWVLVVLLGNLSCLGFHATVIRFLRNTIHRRACEHPRSDHDGAGLCDAFRDPFSPQSAEPASGSSARHRKLLCDSPLSRPVHSADDRARDVLDGTARAHSWPIVAMSPTYLVGRC